MLRDTVGLGAIEQALIVALPVLVGCLGRVPVGALSDRFGGRAMFLAVTAVAIVALAELAAGGYRSTSGLMIGAVLLGAAGTTFAAGVQFVSGWFPGAGRGLAVGVLGMGVCGNAAGGLTAARWADAYGTAAPFVVSAVLLAACGAAVLLAVSHDRSGGYGPAVALFAIAAAGAAWSARRYTAAVADRPVAA